MSVNSTDEYLKLLRKSGALDEATFNEVKERFAEFPDARQLARKLVDRNYLSDWQARFLLSGRHRLKIGQYKLLDRFPKQEIGDRFLAIHEQLARKVDVLIFPKDAAKNKTLFQQFLNQASMVAELDHANLLHLYDIDQEAGRYFLVFEHDDGDSLRNVADGKLNARSIASIAQQSLDGISCAHKQNVIHGKLDETQMRVDRKGRVTIRNIGLARLLDELKEQSDETDEFAITPDPSDDIAAIGRICKTLFRQHIGQPVTDLDKSLYLLLGRISKVTDAGEEQTISLLRELTQWTESETRERSQKAAPKPGSAPSGKPQHSESAKSGGVRTRSKKTGSKKRKTWLGLVVTVGLLAIAGGIWFAVTRGADRTPVADNLTEDDSSQGNRQTPEKQTSSPLDAASAGFSKTGIANNEKSGTAEALQDPDPSNADEEKSGKTESALSESSASIDDEPKWSNATTSESSDSDVVMNAATAEMQQEPAVPPKTIVMEGAEGLPLVSWQEAPSMLNKDAVVYGTVVQVESSNSGKTRYINFKKDDRSVFKIVVRQRDLEVSEEELKKSFLNKHVCIRGLVRNYRGEPEIAMEMLEQLKVLSGPPNAETKLVGKSPSSTSDVETSGVFAGMAGGVHIPELNKDASSFERVVLGPVKIGDDPLGLFLTVPEEACTRPIWFGIERDQTGRRWEISYAAKANVAEDTKKVVAEIHFENDEIHFNWIRTGNISSQANYLQNCLLEIRTPDESKTVVLRKPVRSSPIVLDEKRPVFKDKISLKYLPNPTSISVEFLPLPKAEFEMQYSDFGTTLNIDLEETTVLFDSVPQHQFFRLWYAANISGTIRLDAALQINTPEKPMIFNKRNLKTVEENLMALQTRINQANAAAVDYEPQRGEKTKHKETVKELSEQLEIVNGQVAAFQVAKARATSIVGRELKYRIYFTVDDIQFDLVTPHMGDQ